MKTEETNNDGAASRSTAGLAGEALPSPTASNLANQCRQMGLIVGDVIVGREDTTYRDLGFHEVRLTLLWLGEMVAVFREEKRSDLQPEWSSPIEECCWSLDCRDWHKMTAKLKFNDTLMSR